MHCFVALFFSLSISLSLSQFYSIKLKKALLAWEIYIYIAKAGEQYNTHVR